MDEVIPQTGKGSTINDLGAAKSIYFPVDFLFFLKKLKWPPSLEVAPLFIQYPTAYLAYILTPVHRTNVIGV